MYLSRKLKSVKRFTPEKEAFKSSDFPEFILREINL